MRESDVIAGMCRCVLQKDTAEKDFFPAVHVVFPYDSIGFVPNIRSNSAFFFAGSVKERRLVIS